MNNTVIIGNHFTEPEIKTAKDFIWCINQTDKGE